MIKKFDLIVEKAGINLDVEYLSQEIYNLINDGKKSTYIFDGKLFNTENLHIDKIKIYIGTKDNPYFSDSDSKITEKGIILVLYLNQDLIDINIIHHELDHALKFYMKGKEKSIENVHQLKAHFLANIFLKNNSIKEFIDLIYYSDLDEIDSFASECYYEIMKNFKNKKTTERNFNALFKFYYQESTIYDIKYGLDNYDFKKLKKLNSDHLIIFFNVLNDKKNLLKIARKNNKLKNILMGILDSINGRYFNDRYYRNIDKSVKIENLDEILNIYKKRFNKASNKISEKIPRLYQIILDELKKQNNII